MSIRDKETNLDWKKIGNHDPADKPIKKSIIGDNICEEKNQARPVRTIPVSLDPKGKNQDSGSSNSTNRVKGNANPSSGVVD